MPEPGPYPPPRKFSQGNSFVSTVLQRRSRLTLPGLSLFLSAQGLSIESSDGDLASSFDDSPVLSREMTSALLLVFTAMTVAIVTSVVVNLIRDRDGEQRRQAPAFRTFVDAHPPDPTSLYGSDYPTRRRKSASGLVPSILVGLLLTLVSPSSAAVWSDPFGSRAPLQPSPVSAVSSGGGASTSDVAAAAAGDDSTHHVIQESRGTQPTSVSPSIQNADEVQSTTVTSSLSHVYTCPLNELSTEGSPENSVNHVVEETVFRSSTSDEPPVVRLSAESRQIDALERENGGWDDGDWSAVSFTPADFYSLLFLPLSFLSRTHLTVPSAFTVTAALSDVPGIVSRGSEFLVRLVVGLWISVGDDEISLLDAMESVGPYPRMTRAVKWMFSLFINFAVPVGLAIVLLLHAITTGRFADKTFHSHVALFVLTLGYVGFNILSGVISELLVVELMSGILLGMVAWRFLSSLRDPGSALGVLSRFFCVPAMRVLELIWKCLRCFVRPSFQLKGGWRVTFVLLKFVLGSMTHLSVANAVLSGRCQSGAVFSRTARIMALPYGLVVDTPFYFCLSTALGPYGVYVALAQLLCSTPVNVLSGVSLSVLAFFRFRPDRPRGAISSLLSAGCASPARSPPFLPALPFLPVVVMFVMVHLPITVHNIYYRGRSVIHAALTSGLSYRSTCVSLKDGWRLRVARVCDPVGWHSGCFVMTACTGSGKTTMSYIASLGNGLRCIDVDGALAQSAQRVGIQDARLQFAQGARGGESNYNASWLPSCRQYVLSEVSRIRTTFTGPILVLCHMPAEMEVLGLGPERYMGFVSLSPSKTSQLAASRSVADGIKPEVTLALIQHDIDLNKGAVAVDWPVVQDKLDPVHAVDGVANHFFPGLASRSDEPYVRLTSFDQDAAMSDSGFSTPMQASDVLTFKGGKFGPRSAFPLLLPIAPDVMGDSAKIVEYRPDLQAEVHRSIKLGESVPVGVRYGPRITSRALSRLPRPLVESIQNKQIRSRKEAAQLIRSRRRSAPAPPSPSMASLQTSARNPEPELDDDAVAAEIDSIMEEAPTEAPIAPPAAAVLERQSAVKAVEVYGKEFPMGPDVVDKSCNSTAPAHPPERGTSATPAKDTTVKFIYLDDDSPLWDVGSRLAQVVHPNHRRGIARVVRHGRNQSKAASLRQLRGLVVDFESADALTAAIRWLPDAVLAVRLISDPFATWSKADRDTSDSIVASLQGQDADEPGN